MSSPARIGSASASTSRIAAWMWATARAGSWKRATLAASGQEVDPVAPGPGLGVGDLVPQVDRSFELVERLGERIAGRGVLAGHDRRFERAREVVRGVPVIGQLGRVGGIAVRGRASSVRAKAACSRVRSPGSRSS